MKDQIAAALPKHMSPDRMIRVMLTAINSNPKLLACTQESLLAALMKCSQYGLEPDGRHAHLIPYKDHCQLIFDYKGMVSLVRRSGDVTDIHCDVVYEKDEFEYSFGSEGGLRHKPNLKDQDRGEIMCAYSFVRLKDGGVSYEVLPWWEIEKVKENSQGYKAFKSGSTQSNPWESNWSEMAKKTAFRRHSKWLPLSFELQEQLADDADSEESRFAAAKPVIASAPFELPPPQPVEEEPTQEPTNAPAPATTGPSRPHDELRVWLEDNNFTADDFLRWAEGAGHIPPETPGLTDVPDDTVKRLLRAKGGLKKGLNDMKEALPL